MEVLLQANALQMGSRTMYATAGPAASVIRLIDQPSTWDPLAKQPHGNRVRSKDHVAAIKEYIEHEENPILNSIVVYARNSDVTFAPADGLPDVGHLKVKIGARFDVGDGQHRCAALAEALAELDDVDDDDPRRVRVTNLSVPLLVVIDDDPARRAQDFVDLQRNAKPPSGSLGSSMDRRHAINRFTLDVAKSADLTNGGQRVEFLKDTIGKLSGKLYTFQAFRQFVTMLIIGSSQRTRAGLEKAADEAVGNGGYEEEFARVLNVFNTAAHTMPGWAEIMDGSITVAEFRADYLLATAAGLYTLGVALYKVHSENGDVEQAIAKAAEIDWRRAPVADDGKSFFDDTLILKVENDDGTVERKIGSGRPAWEAAGEKLYDAVK
ncbi:MAG TPA: DNA sulfur modification protein DndB [Solirubrobacteraceae bacterium]|nr:DNA sulfur modification protein DndB [Solirubrobacteraceae bacterium]